MTCGGRMSVLLERIEPAHHLVLFGGGHVARPTADFAYRVGFRVTVVDPRPEWASPDRFPSAQVINEEFEEFLARFRPQPNHYLVLVTQGHAFDQMILERVLAGKQRYTGVIGSKNKAHQLRKAILQAGFSAADWGRVHCPLGLPLGGDSPAEIALSIVAQLVQIRYAKTE